MTKKLIILRNNWADEFDIEGFAVMDAEDWDAVVEGIPDKGGEACIGTNQFKTYKSKQEFLDSCKVFDLMDKEVAMLKGLFGRTLFTFGMFDPPSENW